MDRKFDRYSRSCLPLNYNQGITRNPQLEEDRQFNKNDLRGEISGSARLQIFTDESSVDLTSYFVTANVTNINQPKSNLTDEDLIFRLESQSSTNPDITSPVVDSFSSTSCANPPTPSMVNNYKNLSTLSSYDDTNVVTTSITTSTSAGTMSTMTSIVPSDHNTRLSAASTPEDDMELLTRSLTDTSGSNDQRGSFDKYSDEYRRKRERNNEAVRKSRKKTKLKSMETQERVIKLSHENEELKSKLSLLTKELSVLKSLFVNSGVVSSNLTDFSSDKLDSNSSTTASTAMTMMTGASTNSISSSNQFGSSHSPFTLP